MIKSGARPRRHRGPGNRKFGTGNGLLERRRRDADHARDHRHQTFGDVADFRTAVRRRTLDARRLAGAGDHDRNADKGGGQRRSRGCSPPTQYGTVVAAL